jgi:hypothetical protein
MNKTGWFCLGLLVGWLSVFSPLVGAEERATTANPALNKAVDKVYQDLMQDPELLKRAMSMQNDPNLQALMKDASFQQAMDKGDLDAMMRNPDVQALLNHPVIQELNRKGLGTSAVPLLTGSPNPTQQGGTLK